MRYDYRFTSLLVALVLVFGAIGCGKKSATPTPPEGANEDVEAPEIDFGSDDEEPAEETVEETTEEPSIEAPSADEPATEVSNSVLLGSPDLTAGIAGDGPLSDEEIAAWLAKPENHATLEVELPFGLAAGAAQIQGLDENPLTRAKIELGRQLYFDTRLSSDNTISCASCHAPDEGFARHTQFGVGVDGQMGDRNSPVSYNRILSGPQFWDGRAPSLEAQAVGPIANPIEMGNTHEKVVASLKEIPGYAVQFAKIFDDGVTIDNVGLAIASFERTIVTGPSPYDFNEKLRTFAVAYADDLEDLEALREDDPELVDEYEAIKKAADAHPMSDSAKHGRELFFTDKAACTACHAGANFTDEKYHNLGVGMAAAQPQAGRFTVTKDVKDTGAFKTPTIRNVELSAPYMHDGSQKTLEEVVDWYTKGGHPNAHLSDKMKALKLTDQDKADLVAFMKACTGDFPKIEEGRLPK